jgi:hypothetical protein
VPKNATVPEGAGEEVPQPYGTAAIGQELRHSIASLAHPPKHFNITFQKQYAKEKSSKYVHTPTEEVPLGTLGLPSLSIGRKEM